MGLFSRSAPQQEEVQPKKVQASNPNAILVPLERPAPGTVSQPEVPNDKSVSDEEKQVRYNTVLKHFQNPELQYPLSSAPKEQEKRENLTPIEKSWLTKECFLRYLRACNWNTAEAIKRLESSVVWRREYGIYNGIYGKYDSKFENYGISELSKKELSPDVVKHESESGKQILFGYDKGCRPCLYLYSGKENTKPSETQVQFLIFMIEATINYMPQGQDKLALCVDFKDYPDLGLKRKPMPSVSVGKAVLNILQYHYPERLGRALFVNIPFVASVFLKLCWPFLDPYTKQKVSFDNPFKDFIPEEQLPTYYDGKVDFEFDSEKYWDGFIKIGIKKRQLYLERFFELGAVVGLSESDLRSNEKVPDTEESVISSAAPAPAVATEKVETDDVHVQSQEVQA